MSIASCSGEWTIRGNRGLNCSGDVTAVDPVQVAVSQREALLLSAGDFSAIATACVVIFIIGFSVKMTRNIMNV